MSFEGIIFSNFILSPSWLVFIRLILANDIELNPGFVNSFFSFCNWNLNSLPKDNFSRIQLLEAHNSLFNYDIISVYETCLNDTVELPQSMLNNYNFIACNNPLNTKRGGVGLFYKNDLPLKVRSDLAIEECIVTELIFGKKKIFLLALYRSPSFHHGSQQFENFLGGFESLYESLKKENPYCIFISGDFNGHSELWWKDGDTNAEGSEIEQLTSRLGLHQLIHEPTNFEPNKNPSCIDLIFTDQPNLVIDSGTRPTLDNFCHHQITYCRMNFQLPPPPSFDRKIWHFDRANVPLIQRAIRSFPWADHFSKNHDPNWQAETFTEILLNIMSNFIPNEIIRVKPRDPPWITKSIKTMLNRQNRMFRNYKKHGYLDDDKRRLDEFRVEIKAIIKTVKEGYLKKIGSDLADPHVGQKCYWKIVNRIMNKCKAPKIPPILSNNKYIINCKEKATIFANFFAKQCQPLINDSVLPQFHYLTESRIEGINISSDEITSLIRSLDKGKAGGSDQISSHMILLCDDSITVPLKLIFDQILATGIYPDSWKLANVTPIYKKGDKQNVKNYRPISLLPIFGKLFEKILVNQLYEYFTSNDLITKNQSGFRSGDSTSNQLTDLVNQIHKALENRYEVRAVFLDISKAFDKVWHEGLLFKLNQNGVMGNMSKLLKNYLTNRKQRVVLNGSSSSFFDVESGVPQGSVLGPLLFLIYINDLEVDIKSKIKFFADDTMLFSVVSDPSKTASDLNHDLNIISKWAFQWKMAFNPEPSKQAIELLFSHKIKSTNHPPIFFNGIEVKKASEHKHLGLILDTKLSFSAHVTEKIKKAQKSLGILKFISSYLPLKTLDQIYKLFIRSQFDYGDTIYHIPPTTNSFDSSIVLHPLMESIERIQYNAARVITGTWKGTSTNKLYEELGWESLSDRRWSRRLIQFFKIHKGLTPAYLSENLPPKRRLLYGKMNPNIYQIIPCKTSRYKKSFFPDVINSWNNLEIDFHESKSLAIFKKKINVLIRPTSNSIFGIHDPSGLRFIFQLRVGLSPLRHHKKKRNFNDVHSDICDCQHDSETLTHFLFFCPKYFVQRTDLQNSTRQILQRCNLIDELLNPNLYLYGNESLSVEDNNEILRATIKYIIETERFELLT